MVLNEEHNERTQKKWLSRIARERLDLSVSVEEALDDPTLHELHWGEEESPEGTSQKAHGQTLFPPRLSLQSRPMPVVRRDLPTMSQLNAYAQAADVVQAADAVKEEETHKAPVGSSSSNILVRFAQRLTSSLAALGAGVVQEEIVPFITDLERTDLESSQLVKVVDGGVKEPTVDTEELLIKDAKERPLPVSSSAGLQSRQAKQKLAGRATRVRLETPPGSGSGKAEPHQAEMIVVKGLQESVSSPQKDRAVSIDALSAHVQNDEVGSTGVHVASIDSARESVSATSMRMPVISVRQGATSSTGADLPAVAEFEGKSSGLARSTLSGSGVFEPGQSEATIANSNVTTMSVILTMLTANPGPVVVQYVSLQPHVGFTVHLTAPATARATFNYVVLLGELF